MATGDDLRTVLRSVPAPVAVVTVDVEGERLGLTVASLVSLSLDPPLVGFAVGRHAAFLELLRRTETLGVSVLTADQQHIAQHFARGVPPIGMWTGIETRSGSSVPLLEGALGWLECRRVAEHPAGDHTFFVGQVEHAERGEPGEALVYVNQRYESSAPTSSRPAR